MERFLFSDLELPVTAPQSLSYLTYEIGLRTQETLLAELRTRRRMEASHRASLQGAVPAFAEW